MTSNGSDHYAQYGYSFFPTDDCFGVDISHQHMDDLDNLSLKEVYLRATAQRIVRAVDLRSSGTHLAGSTFRPASLPSALRRCPLFSLAYRVL